MKKELQVILPAFLGQGLQVLLTLTYIVVFARLLRPEEFGLFALSWVWLGTFYLITDLGLSDESLQSQTAQSNFYTLRKYSVSIGLGMSLLALALGLLVSLFYQNKDLIQVSLTLAPAFLFHSLAHPYRSVLRERELFVRLNVVQTTSLALAVGIAIVMATKGAGVLALVVLFVLREALTWFGFFFLTPRPSTSAAKEVTFIAFFQTKKSTAGKISLFRLIYHLQTRLDQIMLGFFVPLSVVGLYNRSLTLLEMPARNLITPLNQFGIPLLSKTAPDSLGAELAQLFRLAFIFWIPFAALCFFKSEWVIRLVLGEQWIQGAELLLPLTVAFTAKLLIDLLVILLLAKGKFSLLQNWSITSLAVLAITLFLTARHGSIAVAYSVAIVMSVSVLFLTFQLTKWVKLNWKLILQEFFIYTIPLGLLAYALIQLQLIETLNPRIHTIETIAVVCVTCLFYGSVYLKKRPGPHD